MNKTNNLFSNLNFSDQEKIECSFNEIATKIFNNYLLKINNNDYRITEIEFYYYDKCIHPDPYVHRDCRQRLIAQWYFHRYTNSLKMGNRKGLDITFGNNINYGGIIIRAIQKINNEGKCEPIEGPCNVVKCILRINEENEEKYKGFVEEIEKYDIFENNKIKLYFNNVDNKKYYKAPRVGLNPARNKPEWKKFIMKNYRYFVKHTNSLNYPSNDRELIILSLLKNKCFSFNGSGINKKCIKENFYKNIGLQTIKKYRTCYCVGKKLREKDKKDEKEKFLKELMDEINTDFGVEKKCKLYGLLNEGEKNGRHRAF